MPFTILLAVDGSKHSLVAARHAATMAARSSADIALHLLHVHYRIPPRPALGVGRDIVEAYYHSETEAAVKAARRLLDCSGVSYQLVRRIGNPDTEIVRYAENEGVDLLIMGSHGRGAAKSLLLGSVAQGVIAACSMPVLVVREDAAPERSGKILVAVDGSAFSRRALAYLLRHRGVVAADGPITLLHVALSIGGGFLKLKKREERQLLDAEHDRALRSARRLLTRVHVPWQEVRAQGNAGNEIAAYARRHNPALIVMGSQGHGIMAGLLLGSATQKTIGRCRVPVLIVK